MQRYREQISRALAGRRLVWLGPRALDGEPLACLPEFEAAFGTIAPLTGPGRPASALTLEELSGERADLDSPTFELSRQPGYERFRDAIAASLQEPSVLLPWGPTRLVPELVDGAGGRVRVASIPTHRQFELDDKGRVDAALSRLGIEGLGWRELAGDGETEVARMMEERPCVVRANRTQSGQGLWLVRESADLEAVPFAERAGELMVAPLLEGCLPLNCSACIFGDGSVRLHPASVQLVGVRECTARAFGYCGNDFALPRSLERAELDSLEGLLRRVAAWLRSDGYVGAFGLDALLHGGSAHFVEINPRLQGSSYLSARIADAAGAPSLYLDHLAAVLGLRPHAADLRLADWVREGPAMSALVVRNLAGEPVVSLGGGTRRRGAEDALIAPTGTVLAPGATLGRVILAEQVTTTGGDLVTNTARGAVRDLRVAHSPASDGVLSPAEHAAEPRGGA